METRTDRAGTNRTVMIAGVVILAILAGFGAWYFGVREEPSEETDSRTDSEDAADAQPARPGDEVLLRFTFTGAEGRDGCQYDGPSTLVQGTYASEFANAASASSVAVNLDPLEAGVTYEQFLDQVGAADGEHPVTIASADMTPERQEWLGEGGFRTIHTAGGESDSVALLPGRFVIYCWTPDQATDGAQLWPAGTITVRASG